jgi:uncharacterized protein (DUF302 family)
MYPNPGNCNPFKEDLMLFRSAFALLSMLVAVTAFADDGVIRVKSAYPMPETIARLKQDVAAKGILFFSEIDQRALAEKAGVTIRPSTLLLFGNPPLGTQFINARPEAGLDWPVRLLVQQDEQGGVWAIYTDFRWIAKRHGLSGAAVAPFETAAGVIGSITGSVRGN